MRKETYCKCNVTELDNCYSKKQRCGLPKMFDPVRNQVEINLVQKVCLIIDTSNKC